MPFKLVNVISQEVMLERVLVAKGIRFLLGLIGDSRGSGTALYLPNTRTIHTFGMGYALDLIFVDHNLRVVGLNYQVGTGRVVQGPASTNGVIEVESKPHSAVKRLSVGDDLELV